MHTPDALGSLLSTLRDIRQTHDEIPLCTVRQQAKLGSRFHQAITNAVRAGHASLARDYNGQIYVRIHLRDASQPTGVRT